MADHIQSVGSNGESSSESRLSKDDEIAQLAYKELKIGTIFVILFAGFTSVASAFYRSNYAVTAFAIMMLGGIFYIVFWGMALLDKIGSVDKHPFEYTPIILLFKRRILFVCSATLVALMIIAVYPLRSGSRSDSYNQSDWYNPSKGTFNEGVVSGLPKDDKNRPDPCKVFDGLCKKDAVNLASLLSQNFEIKSSDLKEGEFLLQKGTEAFSCQKMFPTVDGYILNREAEIGSALCKQIRKGNPVDMDNYIPISSE